jgi:hypothetical protein
MRGRCDAPDFIAHIVRDERSTAPIEDHLPRPPACTVVGIEEAGQDVNGLSTPHASNVERKEAIPTKEHPALKAPGAWQ